MKKKQLHIVGLVAFLAASCVMNGTSYLRTPLSLWRGVFHYPLPPVDPAHDWQVELMGAFYGRSADQAYVCNQCCDDGSTINLNQTTRCTKPLSILFFDKTDFTVAQAFGSGPLLNTGIPALSFDILSPRIQYKEYGAIGTLNAYHKFNDDSWRFGGRAILPFAAIEVDQTRGCGFEEPITPVPPLTGGTIFERQEETNSSGAINTTTYAYRMDYLSTLLQRDGTPMVTYNAVSGLSGVQIANQEVSRGAAQVGTASIVLTPADAIGFPQLISNSADPVVPPMERFVSWVGTEVGASNALPADGSTVAGNRYYFQRGVAYNPTLSADIAAQSQLFVVPVGTSNDDGINPHADNIYNAVQDVLSILAESGLDSATNALLQTCCIDMCNSSRTVGIGDLDLEVYLWSMSDHGFAGLFTGFRFPTGKKNLDPRKVYYQTIGNNGHYEYRVGLEGGWHPIEWFAFKADASYQHVFRATERRAAPFVGATVANIGPAVNAEVSWNYVVVHADLNFFHPQNPNLGCLVGYEFFDKGADKVCLCCEEAINCLTGLAQPLNPNLLSAYTKRLAHKIRFEAFNRFDYWELFGGVSEVIAGSNAMKETEWHLGVNVYF